MAQISADRVESLLNILYAIKAIDSEFPLQYAICLCEIARDEGCSLTDLSERTGLALSTVSRIVGALSNYRQSGEPYQFITLKLSEIERRKKHLFLTDDGRKALKSVVGKLKS